MRILIMPKPWALFGLRFLMIFARSSLGNETVERRLFVLFKESVRSLLVFSTSVYCLAKKSLKIWVFSLKSVKCWLTWIRLSFHYGKLQAWGKPCIRLSLHHENHMLACMLAFFRQYCLSCNVPLVCLN